jgi:hypothetical protein
MHTWAWVNFLPSMVAIQNNNDKYRTRHEKIKTIYFKYMTFFYFGLNILYVPLILQKIQISVDQPYAGPGCQLLRIVFFSFVNHVFLTEVAEVVNYLNIQIEPE